MNPQDLAWRAARGLGARPQALLETPASLNTPKRFSLWAGEPLFILEGRAGRAWLRCGSGRWPLRMPPEKAWAVLGRVLALRKGPPAFWPLLQAFSYEAGNRFERLSKPLPEPLGLPDWWAFLPGLWAVWGHRNSSGSPLHGALDPASRRRLARAFGLPPAALDFSGRAPREAWKLAQGWARDPSPAPAPETAPPRRAVHDNMGSAAYRRRVQVLRRHILEGDIYQANLAHQWWTPYPGDALDLYRRLTLINPSPMAAYADLGGVQVVSASPERLFRMRGARVETWPIAGTAKNQGRPGERAALRRSAKNAAEHVMLVDLERNDLGRVCVGGSVQVPRFRVVESYSHVHHLVSQVTGRLKPGLGLPQLLEAGFPGGSITGAPKLRCRRIIQAQEGQARGWYTGSLGWWEPRRRAADLNILIRTVFLKAGRAYASVGAGIVLDSDPRLEWEETQAKGAALRRALGRD